ncbi:hypothetical protein PoB_006684100 [Plakobranchus ocellatus]|uniref:Uncharacterized protein n=1 Tax=Plakobranchus ocellatus TaxID=259542 RepID=A0AAV4D8S5_9GAST|nr:hypothetical protein PoB_006684100 [Plakobranchus ocellatus]
MSLTKNFLNFKRRLIGQSPKQEHMNNKMKRRAPILFRTTGSGTRRTILLRSPGSRHVHIWLYLTSADVDDLIFTLFGTTGTQGTILLRSPGSQRVHIWLYLTSADNNWYSRNYSAQEPWLNLTSADADDLIFTLFRATGTRTILLRSPGSQRVHFWLCLTSADADDLISTLLGNLDIVFIGKPTYEHVA